MLGTETVATGCLSRKGRFLGRSGKRDSRCGVDGDLVMCREPRWIKVWARHKTPLTTDADDTFVGSSLNDTITAASGTLQTGDLIVDASSTDSDTLNVVFKAADAAQSATINGIENVNVSIDEFDGANATFNAVNVRGATITLSSEKLGFNGKALVNNAGGNNVTAGTNVTELTVTGLTTGVVNTGSVTTASVTGSATQAANVTVNGDIALTLGAATEAVIKATAASDITLTPGTVTKLTVNGASDVTVTGAASPSEIVNGLTAGSLTAVAAGATDVEKWDVDTIEVGAAATLTNVALAPVELTAAGLTVSAAGKSATESNVVISTASNQTSITATTAKTVAVNVTAAATITTLNVGAIDTTINVAADTTITTLTATGDVVVTGSGNVTVTNATGVASIDASGLNGVLTVETSGDAAIVGGSGNNVVTIADADSSFTGLAGNDTVDATALTVNTIAVASGAGDDTLKIGAAFAAGTIAFNGGDGTDTLWLEDAADLTSAISLTLQGVERIEIENQNVGGAADTSSVTLLGSQLSGKTYTVTTAEAVDNVTVNVTADAATTDLSGLTLANIDSVVITGQATAETIKGTSANDTIIAGGGADVLTGGAGADLFQFAAGNSSAAAVATITDFNIAQFDVLKLAQNTVAVDAAVADVKAAITNGTGSEVVKADVVDGILTVSGADAGAIDTLEEWLAVAQLSDTDATAESMAFVFGGDTYVVSINAANAVENVIKLTGVTGLEAVSTVAGVNTLVIA